MLVWYDARELTLRLFLGSVLPERILLTTVAVNCSLCSESRWASTSEPASAGPREG